jgi:hypothetical protein
VGPITGAPSPSPSPSPVSSVAPITAAPSQSAEPAISQVAPITGGQGAAVPATAPRTGSGYGSMLAQREALRQVLWFGALLALLIALGSATTAVVLPNRRDQR